jgi:PIN domain nuclease of toxin-antitoxin system
MPFRNACIPTPADRLIAATARAYRCELATHDDTLRKLRVATLWKA